MAIDIKVSIERGNPRLFTVEKEKPTLVDLRTKIIATTWGKKLGSDFCFLHKEVEINPEDESKHQLSAFKKNDDIEVVVRRQENSDDKKKTDKDSKSEAKGSKEEPEKTSTKQKSSQAQLKQEEKPNWDKPPENDLIKDKGSYESKDKAYYDNLNQAEKAHLLKRLELPRALKLTFSDGLTGVNKPGYKLSQALTEKNYRHVDPQSVDKNATCFTALEKKAYEMLSDEVKVSLKLPIPQLSAAFGLDVHHETTSETQTQSKKTKLFMVAKRIIPKIKVLIDEETIQLTDEFKNSVAKADDIGKLSEVFNKYGYFIPTAYTIGGSMIVVKEEDFSANDQKTASSKSFGLKVSGDLEKAGVTAGGSVGYNNENKNQNSETSVLSNSRYSKDVKGGDQGLEKDPAKWVSTLTFDKWAIVEYEDLKQITDFLPQDLKEKCKKLLTPAPLNKLPQAVAEEMMKMAGAAAYHAAHKLQKNERDAVNEEINFKKHANNVIKQLKGNNINLSPALLDNIKQGAWNVAWYTAHECLGKPRDGEEPRRKYEQLFESIKNSNEVTKDLATNITEMCKFGAWHRARWQKAELRRDKQLKKESLIDIDKHKYHYEEIYN